VSGAGDTEQATTPTQHQPSMHSIALEDTASLQSSPSLQPPVRVGAALHRQRLASSQATGSDESGSVSSNSEQLLVPARFQAGECGSVWQMRSGPSQSDIISLHGFTTCVQYTCVMTSDLRPSNMSVLLQHVTISQL